MDGLAHSPHTVDQSPSRVMWCICLIEFDRKQRRNSFQKTSGSQGRTWRCLELIPFECTNQQQRNNGILSLALSTYACLPSFTNSAFGMGSLFTPPSSPRNPFFPKPPCTKSCKETAKKTYGNFTSGRPPRLRSKSTKLMFRFTGPFRLVHNVWYQLCENGKSFGI